ncbi:MAG TPA: AAA family ATPase, partial [Steroidobacteraceae bacterium]
MNGYSHSSTQTAANDALEGALTRFTEVREWAAAWLWPGWLPLGKLAIVDGDPGLGKSTLLFDLAARVSKDGVMPDGSQGASGSVLILNAEDDAEDTIKPRLLVAGAELERVFHVKEVGPAGTSARGLAAPAAGCAARAAGGLRRG